MKIGIFFGTNTGNTENISYLIKKKIGDKAYVFDISNSNINNFKNFNILLLGTPTWYYGEIQYDWQYIFNKINNFSFKNKNIFLFGCGDQLNYSDNFCDGIYILYNFFLKKNANIYKYINDNEYFFKKSKCFNINNNLSLGLALDEDNQKNKTNERINIWLEYIYKKIK